MRTNSNLTLRRSSVIAITGALALLLAASHAIAYNWLQFNGDAAHSGNNRLEKSIDANNVAMMAFKYQVTLPAVADGAPVLLRSVLTASGVKDLLFVTTKAGHVVALDAKTGRELWRYKHTRRTEKMCCGPANRGVAVAYGKVFLGTVDARLIALDQNTGKPLWDIALVENLDGATEKTDQLGADDPNRNSRVSGSTGVGANMAPLVYRGKVIIGITGVGYGLHLDSERAGAPLGAVVGIAGQSQRAGFYAAFDANTGKKIWQFDSTPTSGWEGQFRETTADGAQLERDIGRERDTLAQYPEAASRGGGSAWTTPAIDPKENLIFVGVGNPSPQMDDMTRPGDNLYTVSLVALDADSGAVKWYYQEVPHDMWGYDVASPPVLFEVVKGYDTIPAIGQAGKTGWFYVMDRRDGRLLFKSDAFVPQQNMFKRPTAEGIEIAPGGAGGSNWSPVSFDARTGIAFVAAIHWPMLYTVKEIPATADKAALRYTSLEPGRGPRWGLLSAIDTRRSGKIKWQVKTTEPLVGGVLATAGDVLFVGEGDGNFNAFNSETGELLWQTKGRAGVNAPPITYQVGGKQYVAVAAGGNSLFGFKQGDEVMVFALPE